MTSQYVLSIPTNKGMQQVIIKAEDSFEAAEIATSRLEKRGHTVDRLAYDGCWYIDKDEQGRKWMTLICLIA